MQNNSDTNHPVSVRLHRFKDIVPNKTALNSDASCKFKCPQATPRFRPTDYKSKRSHKSP